MSRPFQPSGIDVARHVPRRGVGGHLLRDDDVGRDADAAGREQLRQCSTWSVLDERVADRVALRDEERERHRAADEQRVAAFEQRVDHAELVAHLHAAEHRRRTAARARRAAGSSTSTSRASSRPAADGRTRGGPTIDACARCAAPNASLTYTSPSSLRFVANAGSFVFLARIEAQVLEHHHVARREALGELERRRSRRPRARAPRRAEQLAEPAGDRRERVLRVDLALRPAEVRAQHDRRLALAQPRRSSAARR